MRFLPKNGAQKMGVQPRCVNAQPVFVVARHIGYFRRCPLEFSCQRAPADNYHKPHPLPDRRADKIIKLLP